MSVYLCMCAFVAVCVYACVCVHVCICEVVSVCVYAYVCMCVCVYVCMCVYVCELPFLVKSALSRSVFTLFVELNAASLSASCTPYHQDREHPALETIAATSTIRCTDCNFLVTEHSTGFPGDLHSGVFVKRLSA